MSEGLLPLALLGLRTLRDRPYSSGAESYWGPAEPWVRPLLLTYDGDTAGARAALLRGIPDPPRDPHAEALWCFLGRAAVATHDHATVARAPAALLPAVGEQAGAAGGLFTAGPVAAQLSFLAAALA